MLNKGLLVKINSDTFTVQVNDIKVDCKVRGKFRQDKIKPLVGDIVEVDIQNKVIEKIKPRRNYLLRPSVANIDIALIVTSIKKPTINLSLLDKLISMVIINKIEPVIVFTKIDLLNEEEKEEINKLSKYYNKIGIKVFNNSDYLELEKYLKNKIITVCGQTGAGKSTLINKFDSSLNLKTDSISEALGRGKHTTRIVELFSIKDFYIVDTPGFSALTVSNFSKEDIKNSFIEFKNYHCKFKDCLHVNEKDCEVKEAVKDKKILESRYANYLKFLEELK